MSGLHVEGVGVSYGELAVLEDLDLTVQRSEVVVLLGPSGSGKTTLLRVVAGLRCPDSGRIRWAGENLTDMPVHRRGVGLVFQDNALFPHRDVEDNVAFGLRVAGVPVESRMRQVAEMLRLVGLDGFAARSVDTLSGGEAQRVALARALAPGPRLLLLDEPFGSLDRVLRDLLVGEVGGLLRALGQTALHVTHDRDEAFAIADRIAVLGKGRIQRIGTPAEVWAEPGTVYAARCLGHENLIELDSGGRCPLGRLAKGAGTVLVHGDRVVIGPSGDNSGPVGTVVESVFRGETTLVRIRVGDLVIGVPSTARVGVGSEVAVILEPGAVVPLD